MLTPETIVRIFDSERLKLAARIINSLNPKDRGFIKSSLEGKANPEDKKKFSNELISSNYSDDEEAVRKSAERKIAIMQVFDLLEKCVKNDGNKEYFISLLKK